MPPPARTPANSTTVIRIISLQTGRRAAIAHKYTSRSYSANVNVISSDKLSDHLPKELHPCTSFAAS